MAISFNAIFTTCYTFVQVRLTHGLSPLEKKVALIVLAYFTCAALGYLMYQCCCFKAQQMHKKEIKEQDFLSPVCIKKDRKMK